MFFGEDQGKLLYRLGSDSPFLDSGNKAFDQVLEKHSKHPLAVYAQLVKGTNGGREFKLLTSEKTLQVRKPQYESSVALLSEVVTASKKGAGVDNITLNMTMSNLARQHIAAGDNKKAGDTMDQMIGIFNEKKHKPHLIARIEEQAAEIVGERVRAREAGA